MYSMKLVIKKPAVNIHHLPNYQFNRIVHLSDIHVRPLSRHYEYRTVFQRLYQQIDDLPDSIIVITGDIFDSKHTFKPDTYMIVREFLKNLAIILNIKLI